MNETELKELLPHVIRVAKLAGKFIREEKEIFTYSKVEIKGLNDLVSHVDKEAEKIIVKELQVLVPLAGFIVEENTVSEKKDLNWIVDPLDGTTNFVHGIPCYSVSIALEEKGAVILGVVYEISRNECFYAYKGGAAFLDGVRIQVSDRKSLSESLIATGFPIYNFSRIEAYMSALKYFMQHTHGIRRIGSAATDLCYLACGRVDAFFEYNLNPWDVAAGALIVAEAGGNVKDFLNGTNWLFGKEIACCNMALEQEFHEVIKTFFTNGDRSS